MADKFLCESCGSGDSKVIDGRVTDAGYRRIRECRACHARFVSLETVIQPRMKISPRRRKPYILLPDSPSTGAS